MSDRLEKKIDALMDSLRERFRDNDGFQQKLDGIVAKVAEIKGKLDPKRLQAKLEAEGFLSTLLDGDELVVQGAPSARIGDIADHAGLPLHELVSESSSLEDVFLELTKGEPS